MVFCFLFPTLKAILGPQVCCCWEDWLPVSLISSFWAVLELLYPEVFF